MDKRKLQRVIRPATAEERQRHEQIRAKVIQEFPPADASGLGVAPPGIPAQVRQAREAKGLTWHVVAELAGIADSGAVRDIEAGRDVQLSSVQAVAKVLGLRLELIEESV